MEAVDTAACAQAIKALQHGVARRVIGLRLLRLLVSGASRRRRRLRLLEVTPQCLELSLARLELLLLLDFGRLELLQLVDLLDP